MWLQCYRNKAPVHVEAAAREVSQPAVYQLHQSYEKVRPPPLLENIPAYLPLQQMLKQLGGLTVVCVVLCVLLTLHPDGGDIAMFCHCFVTHSRIFFSTADMCSIHL